MYSSNILLTTNKYDALAPRECVRKKSPTDILRRGYVLTHCLSMSYNQWGPSIICRGGTSRFITGMYYSEFRGRNKENRSLREVIPSEICPICPVLRGIKSRNYLEGKMLGPV